MKQEHSILTKKSSILRKLSNDHACLSIIKTEENKVYCEFFSNKKTTKKTFILNTTDLQVMIDNSWVKYRPDGNLIITVTGRDMLAGHHDQTTSPSPSITAFQSQHQLRQTANHPHGPDHNLTESPLGWLMRRKNQNGEALLTQAQYDAGEKLRYDYEMACMEPQITQSWGAKLDGGRRGQGTQRFDLLNASERTLLAKERLFKALDAVGPELSTVLVQICCLSSGLEAAERTLSWPKRSAKLVLQIALGQLAIHYGIAQPETNTAKRALIRHIGGAGYRPNQ